MALTLPGCLVKAISYLGYDFPQTNEDVLRRWADHLKSLDKTMDSAHDNLLASIKKVQDHNEGPTAEAFAAFVNADDADAAALTRFSNACETAALGCEICAYAVVILKGVVLFQLALIAPAVAAGPLSFAVKKAVEWAINEAIGAALAKLLAD